MAKELKNLTKRADNYSQWYNDLVVKADLAELSPVRGCMIIKPYGYAIWEKMQQQLDKMFKQTGVQNAYLPTTASVLQRMAKRLRLILTQSSMRSSSSVLLLRPSSGTPIRTGSIHGVISLSSATSGAT